MVDFRKIIYIFLFIIVFLGALQFWYLFYHRQSSPDKIKASADQTSGSTVITPPIATPPTSSSKVIPPPEVIIPPVTIPNPSSNSGSPGTGAASQVSSGTTQPHVEPENEDIWGDYDEQVESKRVVVKVPQTQSEVKW